MKVLFGEFAVVTLTDRRLEADVRGEPIDPARHPIHTEIKAVTFHALEIRQIDGGWRARIVFDL